jgi:hypothetical protein
VQDDKQAWQNVVDACTSRGFALCREGQYKDAYENSVGTVPSGGKYAYTSSECGPAHDQTPVGHRLMSGNSGSVWGCHSDIGCSSDRYFRCCTADASVDYDTKFSLYTLPLDTDVDSIAEAAASDAWESQTQNVKLKSSYMTRTLESAVARYFKLDVIPRTVDVQSITGFAIQQDPFKDLCSGEYCRNGYCDPEAPQCPGILGKNEIEYECQCTNPLWETETGTGIGPEDDDLFVSDSVFTTVNGPCNLLTETECEDWATGLELSFSSGSWSHVPSGCIWNTQNTVYFNMQEDMPCGSGGWRCVCSRENCQENEYCYAGQCLEREKVECIGDGITPNQNEYDCHCGPTALCSYGQYCQEILGMATCSDTYMHTIRYSLTSQSKTIRICNDNEVVDGCVCSDEQNCNSNGKAICNREHFVEQETGKCYDPIETKEKCLSASSASDISDGTYKQYSSGCIVTDSETLFSTGGNFDCQEDAKCICRQGQCEEPSQCSQTSGLVPNTETCRCRSKTNCFGDNLYCDEATMSIAVNEYPYIDTGHCPTEGFITIQTEEACKAAAADCAHGCNEYDSTIDIHDHPHGCIVKDGKTWWNSNVNQIECGQSGAKCKCILGCAAYPRCLNSFTGTTCQCGLNVCAPDEYCYLSPQTGGQCKKHGYCEDVSGDDQLTSTCMCGITECGAGNHCFESIENVWSLDAGVCNSLTEENCELAARKNDMRFQKVTRPELPYKCSWDPYDGVNVIYWNEAVNKTCGANGHWCLCSGAVCKPHGHCDNQDGIDPILAGCSCGMENDCSSPYIVKEDSGTCESGGAQTITDIDECLAASNDIGFSNSETIIDRRAAFAWSCLEASGKYCTNREPLEDIEGTETEVRAICAADPLCLAYDYLEDSGHGHTCSGRNASQTEFFNYTMCTKVNDTSVGCFRQHPNNLEFGSAAGIECSGEYPCICRGSAEEFCHYDSCRPHPKCDHLDGDLPAETACACGELDCDAGDYCSIHLKICSPTGLFPGYVIVDKVAVDTAGPSNLDPCGALGLETIVHHNQETYKFRSTGKCTDESGWTYVSPDECRDAALPSIATEYTKSATYVGTIATLPYGCSLPTCYTDID